MSLGLKFQRSMGTHRTPVVKLGDETCVTQQEGAHKTGGGGEKKQFGLGFLAAGREAVRHHRKEGR